MRSDRTGGGQHLRVRRGTQAFSIGLAASLPEGTVRPSSPVHSIWQGANQSVFIQATGQHIFARKAIISVPIPALKAITFEPALPTAKQILVDSYQYGYYQKVMLVFKTPFWVHKGFCGLTQSFIGPAAVIRDTSSPEDNMWVLTCFVAGAAGKEWSLLPQEQQREALLHQVGELFGDHPEVRSEYVDMFAHEWLNEEFNGYGCPSPSLPPGVLDTVGSSLREPVADVHFVGTETCDVWKGYMEGAVRSGERGAIEVAEGLKRIVARL